MATAVASPSPAAALGEALEELNSQGALDTEEQLHARLKAIQQVRGQWLGWAAADGASCRSLQAELASPLSCIGRLPLQVAASLPVAFIEFMLS